MLEAGSVALVGASPRPGSFGERVLIELERSPSKPEIHLVNPRYASAGEQVNGRRVLDSLDDIDGPVDLVLLAVGDTSLAAELTRAARRGDRSAVIFGSAIDPDSPTDSTGFRARLASTAIDAGMALCGGGCMGFVNASHGLRAIGYIERDPLPAGPIALVTHSGSAFSAMLRTDRPFGYSLAVSSGQELVTTAADYLDYGLGLPETRAVALLLETLRSPSALRPALSRAAAADIPVVALTVGSSEAGRAMVAAHSGALAGSDGAWEALFDAHGVLRVGDLSEMCDTLELLLAGRRAPGAGAAQGLSRGAGGRGSGGRGIAAVLDSGAERALLVDVAAEVKVGFAEISPVTTKRLSDLLDPGLEPGNPLDVWGRGGSPEELFTGSLLALADDESVDAVALAIDLVPEFDGDESYRSAVVAAWEATELPLCVLSNVPAALDREAAATLRSCGIPVLEGTRSGLLALGHLLELRDFTARGAVPEAVIDEARRSRARAAAAAAAAAAVAAAAAAAAAGSAGGRLAAAANSGLAARAVLAEYGIRSPRTLLAGDRASAVAAAEQLGFPVVMKTGESIAHKTEAGGVILGISSREAAAEAYDRISSIGATVTVSELIPPGVELSVGLVRDALLGPLVVVGAGGVLVELLSDRSVALPPLDRAAAMRMLDSLRIRPLLDGFRGAPAVDLEAVCEAICAMAAVALELGEALDALEINPLSCGPDGVWALDVLLEGGVS
jgi:acyl-CoA synthetase (NDP forming)